MKLRTLSWMHQIHLLSEKVCHTLKIVSYHPNVQLASDDAKSDNQPNVQPVARPSVVGSGQGKSRKSKKAKIRLIDCSLTS